jgi:hypothetical protein
MFQRVSASARNTYISTNYVSSWGLKEGVREIIQNLMDAVTQYAIDHGGSKKDIQVVVLDPKLEGQRWREYGFIFRDQQIGSIEYDPINSVVRCTNPGTIPIQAILLGGTHKNKVTSLEIIGRFGEGMKLAALALLRCNKTFTIKTGGKTWNFWLQEDKTFSDICLHFSILDNNTPSSTSQSQQAPPSMEITVAEMGNITVEEWNENIKHFTDLTDEVLAAVPASDPAKGEILLGRALRGRLFVRGIHVQDLKDTDKITFGYNLINIELDRDRRCVPIVWHRYRCTSQVLADVLLHRSENVVKYPEAREALNELLNEVYDMLSVNHNEVYYFHEHADKRVRDQLFMIWELKNGKGVMPLTPEAINAALKQMRDLHLSPSVYPYKQVTWMLYHTLVSSSHFKTVQQTYQHYINDTAVYQPNQPEQEVLNRVVPKLQAIIPNFDPARIVFKELPYQLCFKANDNLFLSKELLRTEEVLRNEKGYAQTSTDQIRECKLLATCLDLLDVSPTALVSFGFRF